MPAAASSPLIAIVRQHAEDSAMLCNNRLWLQSAPHVKLHHLRRLDDRLAAHLDGLAVAGQVGAQLCDAALAEPGIGEVFAASALALEESDLDRFDRLLSLAEALPESQAGVLLASNWASAQSLRGVTRRLLDSPSALRRTVGIVACNSHLIDPGPALAAALVDSDAPLRAQALRAAGESGRRDLLVACVAAMSDEDADCRFWAARSAALLGDRHAAIRALHDVTLGAGSHRSHALSLLLKLTTPAQAASILKALFDDQSAVRTLIRGLGVAGDPHFAPWLIGQMEDLKLARLAGESFSMITGLDLPWLDLDRKPPERVELEPSDDPEDDDIAMDEDDGLPWPDPLKVQAWWSANSQNFQPGVRYFMGTPPSWEHCLHVRRDGYQRQRIAAAEYLCLLQPGTKLFPTSAPAWRQQRWLEAMQA
jgi:uncharacterized protein (TIGR02270 family)